jgi:hypothetical protein
MKRSKFGLYAGILFALSSASPLASAATQLPYFGPDQKNCGVAYPTGTFAEIDAGFVPSEDCSYIYVLPPKIGNFEAMPVQYSFVAANACTKINEAIKGMLTVNATPGTPEYELAQRRALRAVEAYTSDVKEMFPGIQAYASASASLDWNGLVRAYEIANPQLGAQFVAMPIRAGALSMASAAAIPGSIGEFESQLYSVRVSAYTPPATHSGASQSRLPAYLSFIEGDRSSFIMGQSVGLEIRFGIDGACNLSSVNHPEDSLSGTYTYVYPVQSKGFVRYEFNKDILIPVIRDYITSHTGRFSTDELAAVIKQKKAFNVILNEGAFSDSRINDNLEEFKTAMATQATEIMLGLLASQSAVSMAAASTEVITSHSSRECHGALFWRHCNTRHWNTSHTVVNWTRFASELIANFKAPDLSAESYKTFYVMSTSAIAPKKH